MATKSKLITLKQTQLFAVSTALAKAMLNHSQLILYLEQQHTLRDNLIQVVTMYGESL